MDDLKDEPIEDANKLLREARLKYQAADGVQFARYDGFGYKIDDSK